MLQDRDQSSISYFAPDLCRPVHFYYEAEESVAGVAGYRYSLQAGLVHNSTYNTRCRLVPTTTVQ